MSCSREFAGTTGWRETLSFHRTGDVGVCALCCSYLGLRGAAEKG